MLVSRTAGELPYLEKILFGTRRLLDIGCGPANTTIQLAQRLDLEMLYLMDGPVSAKRHGFHADTQAWQDMALTRERAESHGIRYQIVEPDPTATFKVDAIVSLLSWGHHYPVTVYIELAKRSLKLGASLILDIRRDTNGLKHLRKHGFESVAVIDRSERRTRHHLKRVQ